MKGLEQYFPVVLFIILFTVVLTFEYVNKIHVSPFKQTTINSDIDFIYTRIYKSSMEMLMSLCELITKQKYKIN